VLSPLHGETDMLHRHDVTIVDDEIVHLNVRLCS
jgi:hypothetical protein